jgi:hypothetical protein
LCLILLEPRHLHEEKHGALYVTIRRTARLPRASPGQHDALGT